VCRLLTQKNSPILPIHATTNVCYTMRDGNRLFFGLFQRKKNKHRFPSKVNWTDTGKNKQWNMTTVQTSWSGARAMPVRLTKNIHRSYPTAGSHPHQTSRRGGCSTPRSAPMLGTMAQTIAHMTEPDREAIILRPDLTYGNYGKK